MAIAKGKPDGLKFDAALIDISSKESFNEPAKLAERVLAPGDGEAEPGVTDSHFREPAKPARDGIRKYSCFEKL